MKNISKIFVFGSIVVCSMFFAKNVFAAPIINVTTSLSASNIAYNGYTILTWSTFPEATSCSIPGNSQAGSSGSQGYTSIKSTTTYTVTCSMVGYAPGSSSVTVTVARPTTQLDVSVSPSTISPGGSTTLSWTTSPLASNCQIGNLIFGGGSGSKEYTNITSTQTYGVTCTTSDDQIFTNYATVTVSTLSQPNLTTDKPVSSSTNIQVGDDITFTAVVRNTGSASTGRSFYNHFQVKDDATGTTRNFTATSMSTLLSGSTGTTTTQYAFPSVGKYYMRACADHMTSDSSDSGVITESNESDNCSSEWLTITVGTSTVQRPDLVPLEMSPTTAIVKVGKSFSTVIKNQGTASTGSASYAQFQVSSSSSGTIPTYYAASSIPNLNTNETATLTSVIPFNTVGTYYIRACADVYNNVVESNEDNNCNTSWIPVIVSATITPPDTTDSTVTTNTTTTTNKPNLVASVASPQTAKANDITEFTATITNNGNAAVNSQFYNSFYVVTPSENGGGTKQYKVSTPISSLAVGGASVIKQSIPFTTAGNYAILVCADVSNLVSTESNENDNCSVAVAVTVSSEVVVKPDLVVSDISSTTTTVGVAKYFYATVTNQGNADASLFSNQFRSSISSDGSNLKYYAADSTTSLAAGKIIQIQKSITFTSVGTYYIKACADNANNISESNENNNCGASWTTVKVTSPTIITDGTGTTNTTAIQKPDLTTGLMSSSPNISAGFATEFQTSIINEGTAAASGSFVNQFQTSKSSYGTSPTTYTSTSPTINIAVGASTTIKQSITFGSAGKYYVRTCIDVGNSILELNESNNCSSWAPVTVSSEIVLKPDLVVSSTTPTTAQVGIAKDFYATVSNSGNENAGSFSSQFRSSTSSDEANSIYYTAVNTTSLATGKAIQIKKSITFNTTGTYYVKACVDNANNISESNENNNCGASWTTVKVTSPTIITDGTGTTNTTTTQKPDLVASNITTTSTSAIVGEGISFKMTLTNSGKGNSGNISFNNGFYVSTYGVNNDAEYRPSSVSNLEAGKSLTLEAKVKFFNVGTNYIKACADTTKAIVESEENNNCTPWMPVKVDRTDFQKPDLVIMNDVSPRKAYIGGLTELSLKIMNQGKVTTGNGFTNVFQVRKDTESKTTNYLVTIETALAQDESLLIKKSIDFTSEGKYWVRVCADKIKDQNGTGVIKESDEENNCNYWTEINVTKGEADLVIQKVIFPSTVLAGSPQEYSVILKNQGTIPIIGPISNSFNVVSNQLSFVEKSVYSSNIAVGESIVIRQSIKINDQGSYLVTFTSTAEKAKNNNNYIGVLSETIRVIVYKNIEDNKPDLVTDGVSAVTIGSNTEFSAKVKNAGLTSVGQSFESQFQVSTSAFKTNKTIYKNNFPLTILPAGSTETITRSIPFASTGAYYLRACLDTSDLIAEKDENNNCSDWMKIKKN